MLKINITDRWQKTLLALAIGLFVAPVYASGKATISGQVVDTEGLPIAGVTVSVKNAPSVTTNPGGMYTLTGVKQKSRVLVNFEKTGYAPTMGTISLVSKEKHKRDKKHDRDDNDHDDDENHDSKKLLQATLIKTMLRSGATQILNSALGGHLSEKGFKVTFPANSLTVSGNVNIVISPLDVSTLDIKTAPGDFSARTTNGQSLTLESFSMADFTLTQNGLPVNLKPGATADIELLLPTNTHLISGLVKSLWYFNEANGLWQEEGTGYIAPSTTTPGRLAVFATVKHFTTYALGQKLLLTYIRGRVVYQNGLPVAGAYVDGNAVENLDGGYADPIHSHAGFSGTGITDVNGNYCIRVAFGHATRLQARLGWSDFTAHSPVLLVTPDQQYVDPNKFVSTCDTEFAHIAPNLVVNTRTSCISGDVKDINNRPVSGAVVYSTTGGFSTTDVNGTFQIPAPEHTTARVLVAGYPSVAVSTSFAGSPCAVARIRPSVGGGLACVTGLVYSCNPSNPGVPGVVVMAWDANEATIAVSLPSNANGVYCIDGLPANTDLTFTNNEYPAGWRSDYFTSVLGNTGAGGRSCAANTCNAVPALDVRCY